MSDEYSIRSMTREELDAVVEWAAAEGWNPGRFDAETFHQTDPTGFFVGVLDGKPIASISVVAYGRNYGFLGLYIVLPEHRGKGFGLKLWNHAMTHLGDRTVGLDGVVAQQENYARSGFQLAHRNVRHELAGGGTSPIGVFPLASVKYEELLAYDTGCVPAARPRFLRPWIRQRDSVALGIRKDGKLAGYGVIRPARTGRRVGPLFADDPSSASDLLAGLLATAPGEPVFLDVPEPNAAATSIVSQLGGKPAFETARMFTRSIPPLPLDRVFAITTLELG